jgi:hypothetical protein
VIRDNSSITREQTSPSSVRSPVSELRPPVATKESDNQLKADFSLSQLFSEDHAQKSMESIEKSLKNIISKEGEGLASSR